MARHNPLTWRQIPAEYGLEVWSHVGLPLENVERPLSEFGTDIRSLAEFRTKVRDAIGSNPEEREMLLLRRYCDSTLLAEGEEAQEKLSVPLKELRRKIQGSSADTIVTDLLGLSKDPAFAGKVASALREVGGPRTLKILETLPSGKFPGGDEEWKLALDEIRRRLGVDVAGRPEVNGGDEDTDVGLGLPVLPPKGPAPSQAELAELRRKFAANPGGEDNGRVLGALIVYDPAPVVDFIANWTGSGHEDAWHMWGGYYAGSFFAHYCGKDRARNLRQLLKAKDPLVRVTAGVYLRFEDQAEGEKILKELMKIDGDAGAWAALTLARHGDKTAIPRVLKLFADVPLEQDLLWHYNLVVRTLVLLSNTAKASGIQLPTEPVQPDLDADDDETEHRTQVAFQKKVYDTYMDWWTKNADRVKLYDPWVEMLDRQKID